MPHIEHEKGWPSVTTILNVVSKPYLYRWYAKNGWDKCEQIKREASAIGSRIHDAIEKLLREEALPELTARETEMVTTFIAWRKQSGYIPTEIELHVESQVHAYHGTFDSIGHFGNPSQLFILDWKSSSGIDDLYGCQLAAYAAAYKEQTGISVVGGGVVRLEKKADKSPQIEVKQFDVLDNYFDAFLACKKVWEFVNVKNKQKKAA